MQKNVKAYDSDRLRAYVVESCPGWEQHSPDGQCMAFLRCGQAFPVLRLYQVAVLHRPPEMACFDLVCIFVFFSLRAESKSRVLDMILY